MKKFLLMCFSFCFAISVWAQDRVVTGRLTSKEDGTALPGVNVVVKGTTNGTVTDSNGNYSLSVPSSGATLIFSFIGLESQEVAVGERSVLDISLASDIKQLQEVIVTVAGGIQAKQRDLGTFNTVVDPQLLTPGKAVNIAQGLQGKVAGLQINLTGSGVNPNFSIVLRGARSLTGNNQALIVLDGTIVPNSVLQNLNMNDIESINIQNGAGAAAIYGSQASNGVMMITTKKGRSGKVEITASQNTQFQQVAFLPKFQQGFGAGGSGYGVSPNGAGFFSQYENQSYGDAFDGSMRPLGPPQQNGYQEYAKYSYVKNAHSKFWDIGQTNQTDLSFSTGDDKSSLFVSGQYVTVTGNTPGDKFTRANLRVNGTRKISDKVKAEYNAVYAPNTYDITTATGTIYDNMLNMPGNVDVARYKNWQAPGFGPNAVGNPDNFYNPWYGNPYFTAADNRQKTNNNYLTGNLKIDFEPIKGLVFTARQGITSTIQTSKSTTAAYNYSDYAQHTWNSAKVNIPGTDQESLSSTITAISDFFGQYKKSFGDFHLNVLAGSQLIANNGKYMTTYIGGMVVPGLFNLSNGTGNPTYSEVDYVTHLVGAYGRVSLNYKDFLTVTGTGRNDWDSRLNKSNRSFFYPSAEVAAVLSDAFPSIKDNSVINFLKVRGAISKVGQVNIGSNITQGGTSYNVNGAYKTLPVFDSNASNGLSNGFPYGSTAGLSLNNGLVSNNLKPEFTSQYEFGVDANLWRDKIVTSVTWYNSQTTNQTITTSVSNSTGFSSLLTNIGATASSGLETNFHITPIKTADWTVTVGGNYTYLVNTVKNISAQVPAVILQTSSNGAIAVSSAVAGKPFPVIMGTDYTRNAQGKVIVDAVTGLPTVNPNNVILGNATPRNRIGADAVVTYKSFRFSILFAYRGQYSVYNGIGQNLDWSGAGYRNAVYDRKSFVFPNSVIQNADGTFTDNKTVAIVNGNGNNGFWSDGINRNTSSNYMSSGNFIKLREVSLSYDLSSLVSKMGSKFIKGGSISVQGRNLFLWMAKGNYYTDPEYNAGASLTNSQATNGMGLNDATATPPARYFGGTLSLKF